MPSRSRGRPEPVPPNGLHDPADVEASTAVSRDVGIDSGARGLSCRPTPGAGATTTKVAAAARRESEVLIRLLSGAR